MINQRKADHIRINLEEDVQFPHLTTGLARYSFVHQALPEMHLDDVDTRVTLFGKTLAAPLLVSSMTGGTEDAERINRNLAEATQARGLAMGVGSQRAGIEVREAAGTFRVRDVAPDILLFANLGAVQFNYGYTVDECRRAVEMIEADALILHLNPLQEVLQPEGDYDWRDLLAKIAETCRSVGVPVIAKEVGWGISARAAHQLIDAGISAIDVAGAGGTSWSQVEMHRANSERARKLAAAFSDWGLPTADSLIAVRRVREETGRDDIALIASGGIRSGQDVAKCVALGATLVGLASPFLSRAVVSADEVIGEMDFLRDELRIAMFCSATQDIEALRQPGVLVRDGGMHV